MAPKTIRVVKLGGSLLSRPNFNDHLEYWIAAQPACDANLMIVGGGEMIEAMRDLAELHPLDAAAMHWRCVRMLRATYEIAGERLPNWKRIEDRSAFDQMCKSQQMSGNVLVAVDTFFYPEANWQLPETWATTTDAIAAVLARAVTADELVLLKSCDVGNRTDWQALADEGVVDAAFPSAVQGVVNARLSFLAP